MGLSILEFRFWCWVFLNIAETTFTPSPCVWMVWVHHHQCIVYKGNSIRILHALRYRYFAIPYVSDPQPFCFANPKSNIVPFVQSYTEAISRPIISDVVHPEFRTVHLESLLQSTDTSKTWSNIAGLLVALELVCDDLHQYLFCSNNLLAAPMYARVEASHRSRSQ